MELQHQKIQQVIFVRHGIALHNVFDPQAFEGGNRNDLFDPPLTADGKLQAVMVGDTIRGWIRQQRRNTAAQHSPHFMVMTSPLTRCLQTALYAFGIPDEYPNRTTFMCHESLREACGIHRCDARRTKSELQRCWDFCRVQFSPTMSERDELWSPEHRETIADVQGRVENFLSFLITVKERATGTTTDSNIHNNSNVMFIIVTHGVWIETLLRVCHAPYHLLYNVLPSPAGASAATPSVAVPKRVFNGDAYYCECLSSSSPNQQVQLQQIQNFHQICGSTTIPMP
jgi:Histidine phosphatase superfamily (branch 1)